MKILVNDENNIVIFLNKLICKNLDIKDNDSLEDYFKNLFLNLKNNYNINLYGYFIIEMFIDNNYGYIIEITKEELDYFDYFDNQIEMRIIINEDIKVLYNIEDILNLNKIIFDKLNIYLYKNKFYIEVSNISNKELLNLIEQSQIIYKNTNEILNYGKLIKI